MTRVSTAGNYSSALAELMNTQVRAQEAQTRISTQKLATDLTGFGRGGARQAIADALASGRLDGLMQQLQNEFQVSQDGLNTKHQGRYLFAGGDVEKIPVVSMTLADLAAAPSVADSFVNDNLKQTSRLDEGTRMETSFLADEVGTDLFQVFRDIQTYHGTTPISDPMSDATRDFLTSQLTRFDDARTSITDMAARNGAMQNRVDGILTSQGEQKTSLEELLSTKTDADMARAITDLQLAQVAIQASAQVVSQLSQVSLLNYL